MAPGLKALAAKSDHLSSIPRINMIEPIPPGVLWRPHMNYSMGEHVCMILFAYTYTYTHK